MKTKISKASTSATKYLYKSIFLIVTFICIACFVFAQRIVTNPPIAGGNLTTTISYNLTSGDYPLLCASASSAAPGTPRISLFLEFGDGNYSIDQCSVAKTYLAGGSRTNIIADATAFYDNGGGRPTRLLYVLAQGVNTNSASMDTRLNEDENIKITPNVWSVAAGDEMTFAIGYRPIGRKGNIVLLYNDAAQGDIFNVAQSSDTYPYTNSGGTQSISFFRKYRGESLVATTGYSALQGNYNNRIVIEYTTDSSIYSNPARNIFITLSPVNSFGNIPYNTITHLKAILIAENGNTSQNTIELKTTDTHDPNYMFVNPTCVEMRDTANAAITYSVYFQNEGNKIANEITINTFLPREVKVEDYACELGGNRWLFRNNPDLRATPPDPVTGMQKFIIKNAHLRGLDEDTHPDGNLTQGRLILYTKVLPVYIYSHAERTLRAHAEIIFEKNPPVKTNDVITNLKNECVQCKSEIFRCCCCNDDKNADKDKCTDIKEAPCEVKTHKPKWCKKDKD